MAQCFSVGQILHAVGVKVEGGAFPSPAQVLAYAQPTPILTHPESSPTPLACTSPVAHTRAPCSLTSLPKPARSTAMEKLRIVL